MGLEDEIRKAVEADGRSQGEIAKAAKMHEVSLSRFLHGHRGLSAAKAESLARAMGLEVKMTKTAKRKKK